MYGRDEALLALESAIASRAPITVAGELGAGKTTLVDAAMNGQAASAVDDGIVQIPGALGGMDLTVDESRATALRRALGLVAQPPADRCDVSTSCPRGMPSAARARRAQRQPSTSEGAVARLVPGSPVVITSDAAPLGGGEFVAVGALPRADAARLLAERAQIAGPVPADVLDRAAALLQDWPGAVATLADLVKAGRVTMDAAVARMEAANVSSDGVPAAAYERILAVIDATFPRSEVALLETVAGLAGASVREDLADRVAGVPDGTSAGLLAAGMVWRASPRLSMDPGLRHALRRSTTHEGTQDCARNAWRVSRELLIDAVRRAGSPRRA